MALQGQVAIVTGASRGIGKGIALQLGQAGATVYITGRRPEHADGNVIKGLPSLQETAKEVNDRGGKCIAVYVDHSNMEQVKDFFTRIEKETDGKLDILVNNAYSAGVPAGSDAIRDKKFYEAPPEHWDTVNNVGLRNHYFCSVYAARMMVKRGKGLIVNVSARGGIMYMISVPYGMGKCALNRMAADMAVELKPDGVTCVSIWPGPTQTQMNALRMESGEFTERELGKPLSDAESIEYMGKGIVALATDPEKIKLTGRTLPIADLGDKYGFVDVDGRRPTSVRSASFLLSFGGYRLAHLIPPWIKIPGWLISVMYSSL